MTNREIYKTFEYIRFIAEDAIENEKMDMIEINTHFRAIQQLINAFNNNNPENQEIKNGK